VYSGSALNLSNFHNGNGQVTITLI
jgi:hypothetical protein